MNLGVSDGINTEVVSGLEEGQKVVTGIVYAEEAASSKGRNPFGPQRFR